MKTDLPKIRLYNAHAAKGKGMRHQGYYAIDYNKLSLKAGDKVKISGGSGIDSNKTGKVVDRNRIKTDGRGIPTNTLDSPYQPVDWKKEVAVELIEPERLYVCNRIFFSEITILFFIQGLHCAPAGQGGQSYLFTTYPSVS